MAQTSTVVVHLHGASGLPRLLSLNRSLLSPYVSMWLIDKASGTTIGESVSWAPRFDTREPAWCSAMPLPVPQLAYHDLARTVLRVEVWDHDSLLPPSRIGQADVPLESLLFTAESGTVTPVLLVPSALTKPVYMPVALIGTSEVAGSASPAESAAAAAVGAAPLPAEIPDEAPLINMLKRGIYTLAEANMTEANLVRRQMQADAAERQEGARIHLRLVSQFPRRKRLYVIRHGESEWNKAQSGLDLASMYAQVDHPLSLEGRHQAEALAKSIEAAQQQSGRPAGADGQGGDGEEDAAALRDLAGCRLVLSSPLTRALQTCLLALGTVLRRRGQSIRLAPNARERINPGSADSFGCAVGAEEILERVHAKTADLFESDAAAANAAVGGIALEDAEVRTRWWSSGPENKEGVAQRLEAFRRQVQYSPEESVVLVGHSHWIRELLKANLHPSVAEQDPAFAGKLRKQKLSNCGVAQLDLDFGQSDDKPIVGVRLLAGTSLVP